MRHEMQHTEEMLDIALELTFPASDPVALGFDPIEAGVDDGP